MQANYCRKTEQPLLPIKKEAENIKDYDLYPSCHLDRGTIREGVRSLAEYIFAQKTVIIDGYVGIFWNELKEELDHLLSPKGKINIQDTKDWFLSEGKINEIVNPYLGEEGAVWGKRCDKELIDFFDSHKMKRSTVDNESEINILIGIGAALADWQAPVIYFDLPKNELQYRMRADCISNLGKEVPDNKVEMYKRFYFVDWVVLNKHKQHILNEIDIVVDGQRSEALTWIYFNDLKLGLKSLSENVFRPRPWFEPGVWGGQWMKKHINGLNKEEINYAWSFEFIAPENGLLFESDGVLLEISFDFLMFCCSEKILGQKNASNFGTMFPIRFDFLDTVKGGNLSIQCHPSKSYIKENFGEPFTQDETYYILDAEEDAGVYLGFQEEIDPANFKEVLEQSKEGNTPVEMTDYVQLHPALKHDFFLIPNGTVHSAAKGNLVLEISATPYLFTFKMYDWLRLDLNGNPRPINIKHAFNNLNFDRKGEKVKTELISKPKTLHSDTDWKQIHLPTHPEHFYDVHRYDFVNEVNINTDESCHVLMLVEGSSVLLKTKNGITQRFHYAETFVIPAAAENYTLVNEGREEAKVVKAFLKAEG